MVAAEWRVNDAQTKSVELEKDKKKIFSNHRIYSFNVFFR
jgi:hypothetical protein